MDQESDHSRGKLTAQFKKVSGDEYRAYLTKLHESQEEKNTRIDALDGEVSKIPRADTEAYAAYAGSRRDRLDQKKKNELRYILLMINQSIRNIEHSFEAINKVMENLSNLTDKILTSINALFTEMEGMKTDHSEAEFWMNNHNDQTIMLENIKNPHILNILKRYNARIDSEQNQTSNVGKAINDQIDYEQKEVLPKLQDKIQGLGHIYEKAGQGVDIIRNDLDRMKDTYKSINELEDSQVKQFLLEDVESSAKTLMDQADQLQDDLNEKYNVLRHGYASDIESKQVDDKEIEKANFNIGIKPFGL
jgi:hypothetical protein